MLQCSFNILSVSMKNRKLSRLQTRIVSTVILSLTQILRCNLSKRNISINFRPRGTIVFRLYNKLLYIRLIGASLPKNHLDDISVDRTKTLCNLFGRDTVIAKEKGTGVQGETDRLWSDAVNTTEIYSMELSMRSRL